MNITTLTKAIEVLANSATTAHDILILSKVLERLRLGNVTAVSTYADMLTLTRTAGDLVFVDNEQKLYYKPKGTSRWTTILDNVIGTAWAWGSSVGDGTTASRSSPVSTVGGFTDWVQVSAGSSYTVGLRANGTAWTWAGTSPISTIGGVTDWVQVSAGFSNNIAAIRSNGTAWAWGSNASGQLGDNTTISKSSPVSIVGGFTDWVQLNAFGNAFVVGLRSNGTAWCWGNNAYGQLGNNTTTNTSSPVSVVGGFTDWVQVSAGTNHSMGVRSNGTAWAWGRGGFGRLGTSGTANLSSPVSIAGGFTDWIQVDGGDEHSVGVRSNGTAWCWGNNAYGQLGGSGTSRSSPGAVVGGFTDWVQVSAGNQHTVGLRSNGTVWTWGRNTAGQLGDNTTVNKSSPVSVVGGFTDWVQISAGSSRTAGLK